MGNYMRKGKGVGKMAAIESSLGVRTRARTHVLDKELHRSQNSKLISRTNSVLPQESCKSPACTTSIGPKPRAVPEDNSYMELRSRRLGKSVVKGATSNVLQEFKPSVLREVTKSLTSRRVVSETNRTDDKGRSSESNSRRAFVFATGSDARPGTQISLQSSVRGSVCSDIIHTKAAAAPPPNSTSSFVPMPAATWSGILTRHRKQELENLARQYRMDNEDNELFIPRASRASNHDMNLEVEPFIGESQIPANQHALSSFKKENTPDSYMRDGDAPGSTSRNRLQYPQTVSGRARMRSLSAPPFSRAIEAPSFSEIEAFFEGAEQRERSRFIERYNFDPANERPLRGRYEWMNL